MPTEGASKIGSTSTIFSINNTQTTIDTFDIENEIPWNHDPKISDCDGENEIRCDNELTIEDEPITNKPFIGMEFGSADEGRQAKSQWRPSSREVSSLEKVSPAMLLEPEDGLAGAGEETLDAGEGRSSHPSMAAIGELACTYAALILHEDGIPITAEKIATIVKASNLKIDSYWPALFAKLLQKRNIDDLILSVGSGGGGAAVSVSAAPAGGAGAAAAPAAAPAAEEKKEEPKEESDDDMGFSLFD
nr:unnamed protein product [Ananas comosus var. bracteatus]